MKLYCFLLPIALLQCGSALEAEVTQIVKVKNKSFTCFFKIHYEHDTCFGNSRVSCSSNGKKGVARNVELVLDDGTRITIKKLKIKRKKVIIIGCKALNPTNGSNVLLRFLDKQILAARSAPICRKDAISCIQTDVNMDVLKMGSNVQFPNNVTLQLSSRTEDSAVFQGKQGEAIFTWDSKACIAGQVNLNGDIWRLGNCGSNSNDCSDCFVWIELDQNWIEESFDEDRDDIQSTGNKLLQRKGSQDKTTIVTYSVNIWYTPEFAKKYLNEGSMHAEINNMFRETNVGYENSEIPVRVKKHCVAEHPTLHDMPTSYSMINAFKASMSKSKLANSADVMVLLVGDMDSCGRVHSIGATRSCDTYAVVNKICATGYYSFGHEIAHHFGTHHNPEQERKNGGDPANHIYVYGHGYLMQPRGSTPDKGFRTIMAYLSSFHGTRENYYSNPAVIHPLTGQPTGTTLYSNNAKVITEQRFNLAACGDESLECPATSTECKTIDGQRCVFPLNFNGEIYNSCILSPDNRRWCFTELDFDGQNIRWGYCDSSCPGGF